MQQDHEREDRERSTTASGSFGRGDIVFLVFLAVATLAMVVIVATHAWNIGLSDWSWQYYHEPAPLILAAPAIFSALVMVLGVALCLRRGIRNTREEAIAVAFILLVSLIVILYVAACSPLGDGETVLATTQPSVGGYFTESVLIENDGVGVSTYLQDYPKRIGGLGVDDKLMGHLADHPVGPVLCHVLVNRALESWPWLARRFVPGDAEASAAYRRQAEGNTALVASGRGRKSWPWPVNRTGREARGRSRKLVPRRTEVTISDGMYAEIWASALLFRFGYWLALIPVYFLARDLYSREAGLLAVALSALIPSLHLFGPYPDQIFPVVAVGAFYAWLKAVRGRSMLWAALSGFLVLFGLLWSLALLVAAAMIFVGSWLLIWEELTAREGKLDWAGWGRVTLAWFATFAVLSLLPMVLFGYDVWGVWKLCLSKHATFAAKYSRSYLPWVLFNPVDFLIFTGVPICLLMLYEAVRDTQRWWKETCRRAPALLPWALLGVLFLLNFSGKNLGEVARVWMFLMPFAAVSAAAALWRLDRHGGWLAAGAVGLVVVQLLVFRLHLNVMFIF